ncbi:MAG: recombinase family protein [Clostridia bacterium]|nr:recombinase family protein [Clostridia bacterium]
MKKQTAIYTRQSVDKKESLSIEGQIEQCSILTKGETPIIYKDKGYSGKNTDRPDLKRLINDIELDKIGKVIVYKLDRISRNITDFYKLYEIMDKHKCEFISASESFDTSSAMGTAMMGILAVFAQMERNNIQKRVKDNYYYRTATTGSWAGGPAPFGFKNGRNEDKKPTLIPIPEEIEAVELMFALYYGVEQCTLGQVARNLNERGFKPHKRDVFDSVTVSKILQNPIYVKADKVLYKYFKKRKIKFLNSEEDWNGTRTAHIIGKKVGNANIRSYTTMEEQSVYLTNFSGFIPSIQYVAVQERLAENQQFTRNNTAGVLEELGGKLKCKKCGLAIKSYSQSTNGRPYLDCYNNRTHHLCDQKYNNINFWELQEKVGEEIQKQLDNLHGLWQERVKIAYKANEEIKIKQAKLDELVSSFGDDEIGKKAIKNTVIRLQTEIDELEYRQQVALSSSGTLEIFLKHNLTLKESISKGIKYIDLNTEEKRQIIDFMIDKIYLTNDINTFEIAWKI